MQAKITGQKRVFAGYGMALMAAALYGGSSVIAKKAMTENDIAPVVFTSFSLLFGVVIVFLLFHRNFNIKAGVPRRYFGFMIAAGLASGSAITFLVLAVNRAPVAVVTPLASLNPLVTLTLAHLFLQRLERVTARVVAGTVLAVLGVILVIIGSVQT